MAAAVLLAVVVGGATGVGLHAVWDPFDRAAGTTPAGVTPSVAVSTGSSPGRATPTASRTPSPSPSVSSSTSASASSSGSPSDPPSSVPPFTAQALLQPPELVARGWMVARRIDSFDELPSPAITPCTTVDPDRRGVVAGYAATYASDRTSAAEVVARFDSADQAGDAYSELRAAIAGCADASSSPNRVRITGSHHPGVSGIDDLRWWNTRPLEEGAARGVIGIVRVGDRIALLSLSSNLSDPAETTQIESLLTQAGRRLV